jgi:hypothetical protein
MYRATWWHASMSWSNRAPNPPADVRMPAAAHSQTATLRVSTWRTQLRPVTSSVTQLAAVGHRTTCLKQHLLMGCTPAAASVGEHCQCFPAAVRGVAQLASHVPHASASCQPEVGNAVPGLNCRQRVAPQRPNLCCSRPPAGLGPAGHAVATGTTCSATAISPN